VYLTVIDESSGQVIEARKARRGAWAATPTHRVSRCNVHRRLRACRSPVLQPDGPPPARAVIHPCPPCSPHSTRSRFLSLPVAHSAACSIEVERSARAPPRPSADWLSGTLTRSPRESIYIARDLLSLSLSLSLFLYRPPAPWVRSTE